MAVLLVGIGGALGSICRFLLSQYFSQHAQNSTYPIGTFSVNVLGSMVIGALAAWTVQKGVQTSSPIWLFFATGFCGGFTTFSTFSLESLNLVRQGQMQSAVLYISGSVILCLFGCWLGYTFIKQMN